MAATDLSLVSDRPLEYAVALARHFGAHVYLTHVFTGTAEKGQASRDAAEQGLSKVAESGLMDEVPHTVLFEEGFLWQTIDRLIRKHAIDLIVVGTHGRKAGKEDFPGSWAELIFRHAECPVITLGPTCQAGSGRDGKFASILFATDFGRASERAAQYACSLAQQDHAALTLLHVVEEKASYSEEGRAMLHGTTKIRLLESLPPGIEQECGLEFAVRLGDPAHEILDLVRRKSVDLIVMGAKAGRNLAAHLPEPTAYTVTSGAPCPVLTARA